MRHSLKADPDREVLMAAFRLQAPQSLPAGTRTSPIESCSIRYSICSPYTLSQILRSAIGQGHNTRQVPKHVNFLTPMILIAPSLRGFVILIITSLYATTNSEKINRPYYGALRRTVVPEQPCLLCSRQDIRRPMSIFHYFKALSL